MEADTSIVNGIRTPHWGITSPIFSRRYILKDSALAQISMLGGAPSDTSASGEVEY